MSKRLQVLISAELDARIERAAQRSGISKSEWVRRAFNDSLRPATSDLVARMASLNGPAANIAQMLEEIEAGS